MPGHAPQDEQDIDYVDGFERAIDPDRWTLMGELVDSIEHAKFLSFMSSVFHKSVGLNMVWTFGRKADKLSIGGPEPSAH